MSAQSYVVAKPNRDLSMIPGSYGLPLIGHTFKFIDDNLTNTLENYHRYGSVFRLSLVAQNIVTTVGPEFVRQVTLDQDKVFSSQAGWEGVVGEFFSGSLIVQDFEEHRMQRKLMQTAFKSESLHGYLQPMNEIVNNALHSWPVGDPVVFYPAVKSVLRILPLRCFLGLNSKKKTPASTKPLWILPTVLLVS